MPYILLCFYYTERIRFIVFWEKAIFQSIKQREDCINSEFIQSQNTPYRSSGNHTVDCVMDGCCKGWPIDPFQHPDHGIIYSANRNVIINGGFFCAHFCLDFHFLFCRHINYTPFPNNANFRSLWIDAARRRNAVSKSTEIIIMSDVPRNVKLLMPILTHMKSGTIAITRRNATLITVKIFRCFSKNSTDSFPGATLGMMSPFFRISSTTSAELNVKWLEKKPRQIMITI